MTYLARATYEALIAALQSEPAGIGQDRRSHIVESLGLIADIWPDDIREECEQSSMEAA